MPKKETISITVLSFKLIVSLRATDLSVDCSITSTKSIMFIAIPRFLNAFSCFLFLKFLLENIFEALSYWLALKIFRTCHIYLISKRIGKITRLPLLIIILRCSLADWREFTQQQEIFKYYVNWIKWIYTIDEQEQSIGSSLFDTRSLWVIDLLVRRLSRVYDSSLLGVQS